VIVERTVRGRRISGAARRGLGVSALFRIEGLIRTNLVSLNSLAKGSSQNRRSTLKMACLCFELEILQPRFLAAGPQNASMRRIDGQIPARYQCALGPRLAKP